MGGDISEESDICKRKNMGLSRGKKLLKVHASGCDWGNL